MMTNRMPVSRVEKFKVGVEFEVTGPEGAVEISTDDVHASIRMQHGIYRALSTVFEECFLSKPVVSIVKVGEL